MIHDKESFSYWWMSSCPDVIIEDGKIDECCNKKSWYAMNHILYEYYNLVEWMSFDHLT